MADRVPLLGDSVRHLNDVASKIDPADYGAPAYPSEWTVADTFSHLGSGAVIGQRRLEDSIAHRESDPTFNTSVWDEWNAKDPTAQVADCLAADAALLSNLEAATAAQRQSFHFVMGPFSLDFQSMVGLRLAEHALHTWDIEVSFTPHANLSRDVADAILSDIQFIVSRTGKPTGEIRDVSVRTTEPLRDYTIVLDVSSVNLVETAHADEVDLEIPAEAFVRLIYGRLDEAHTPSEVRGIVLNELRRIFPGF